MGRLPVLDTVNEIKSLQFVRIINYSLNMHNSNMYSLIRYFPYDMNTIVVVLFLLELNEHLTHYVIH